MHVESEIARTKSSSRVTREAPVEMVHQIWAVVASAGQVHRCCVMAEVRSWTRSNVHPCRAMSTGEGGRCRTARHELVKMMLHTDDAAVLVRAYICTLQGNAPPCRTADTWPAASATDLLPDAVVSAGGALRSRTAVGEVVSPSWPRG